MNFSQVITRRVADTGGRDPDTLHGLLIAEEAHSPDGKIAGWMGCSIVDLNDIRERARVGRCNRVPPTFDDPTAKLERLPGLFSRQWKRSLIAGMLKPDGIMTDEAQAILEAAGHNTASASAIYDLRVDMKTMGIAMESVLLKGTGLFRYRIIGRDAWRMQKIVANGWAL